MADGTLENAADMTNYPTGSQTRSATRLWRGDSPVVSVL